MEENAALKSALDFETLFDCLPGLYLILSPEMRIIAANHAYYTATGLDSSATGKHLLEVLPKLFPDQADSQLTLLRHSLNHVVEKNEAHALHAMCFTRKLAGGQTEERYWDICNKPLPGSEPGNIAFILHEIHDVTERVQKEQKIACAQAAYKEMNERFALIAKATSDVIWDWNLQTNQVWWNEGFQNLFGYSPDAVEPDASSWTNRIHPDDLDRVVHSIHHAIDLGSERWNDTYRFKCADGTYKYVYDQGYIILDEHGKSVRMLGAMQDVTAKLEIEQQLKEQSEHVSSILSSLPLLIWTAEPDGGVNYYSQQWYDFTGSNFEEMKAWGWSKFIHPDDLENSKSKWLETIASGEPLMLEHRFRAEDGTYRWFLTHAVPIRNAEQEITLWVGSNTDIEAQKQMLTALEQSNDRFKMLAESIPHIVWSGRPDGYVDYFNQHWYDYTKMTEEETLGLGWGPSLHPDDREPTVEDWMTSMRTGQMYERELRLRNVFTEDYRWFLARALPIRDAAGNIITWYGTATDIHEQKVLSEQVEASETKFRFLTESIPQMVWSANPDGYIDYTNQRWYEYTKMDEESLGFGWAPAIHPDELDSLMAAWMDCVATGKKLEFQVRFQDTVAKTYRWFLLRAEPMHNEAGQIIKWFGTATDIHDQVLLREQLQESEKQFRFLAESIPQMIWTTRPDGHHDYFNQRWMDYTGLTLEQSIGLVWNDMLHPEDRQRSWDRWQHSLRTGDYYEIEYRFKNGIDGTYRWFLGQAMPMRDESGNIVKWFGTCTDIEDHKRAEEELVEKNLELERMNQDLDSFVYTASHDLKLPIINMGGVFDELMREATFTDPEAPLLIEMFDKSLKQLQNTIQDLSDVVNVQKNKKRELELISLDEVMQDVLVSLQNPIQTSGAVIETDFDEAPALYFTRSGLKSILYNLLSNAIKYKAQDRTPQISLRTKIKDNFAELTITDNGMGLDLGRHEKKLFQMFRRFHNHVGGSGLGLYIVNRLLTNHGGYINIESKLNEGSTFYLYFKQS